jgi:hypothetical protein
VINNHKYTPLVFSARRHPLMTVVAAASMPYKNTFVFLSWSFPYGKPPENCVPWSFSIGKTPEPSTRPFPEG